MNTQMIPVAAFLLLACAATPASAKSVSTVWTGTMRQVDVASEKSYPMSVRFEGRKAFSEYPELACGGTWRRIATGPDGYEIYWETISHGAEIKDDNGGCLNGVVVVSRKGNQVVLGWFASVDGSPSLASARLTREAK